MCHKEENTSRYRTDCFLAGIAAIIAAGLGIAITTYRLLKGVKKKPKIVQRMFRRRITLNSVILDEG